MDETVPDLRDLLAPHGIGAAAFAAWLGPELGKLRGDEHVRAAMPSLADERQAVRDFAQVVKGALAWLKPLALPPRASAVLGLNAYRAGHDWHRLVAGARTDLVVIGALAQQLERGLSAARAQPGRKRETGSRDALVADVVAKLRELAPGQKVSFIRSLARDVLLRCGARPPSDIKRAERVKGAK